MENDKEIENLSDKNRRLTDDSSDYNKLFEEKTKLDDSLYKFISSENNDRNLPIQVNKPVIKEGIKTYVVYTVISNKINEKVYRRYSDFYALRNKLIERWPGVYIPNIPPKKLVGNFDTDTIESRVKLLNKFCIKLSKFNELYHSEEMEIFLRANDVVKELNNLPLQKYEDIFVKYRNSFHDFYKEYDDTIGKKKINQFQIFLKKAVIQMKTFKEIVMTVVQKKEKEIENYNTLLSVFTDYEKYTLLEYSDNQDDKLIFFNPKNSDICLKLINLKENLNNPYVNFCDWLEEEEIDIEAMIDSINSLQNLYDQKDKINNKLTDIEKSIREINSGKTNLKSFFSFKSKKDDINNLENTKSSLEKNHYDLDQLIKFATYNMDSYIEYFKVEKLAGYYHSLKILADIQKENSNYINDLWGSVAKDKNIQKLINEQ